MVTPSVSPVRAAVPNGAAQWVSHFGATMTRLKQLLRSRSRSLAVIPSVLFCLVAGGRYLWLAVGPGSWGPRFTCAESYFDCGEVSTGRAIEHEFVIWNTGRKPLHVLEARPACGACLIVNVSAKEIAPGDTATLKVILITARLEKGSFRKALLLKIDDPHLPQVILYVHGTVLRD